MIKSKTPSHARASLLDRLVDLDPGSEGELRPLRTLTGEELKKSVRRDLQWLLNTRTSAPGNLIDEHELTVIEYGMPDFGAYSPENPDHCLLLTKRITRSISAFEPRLKNVKVLVEPEMLDEKTLKVRVDAEMIMETVTEPVSFETVFQHQTGTWELHERTQ
ncbi:MAG: type VI secretion system baseplate subunit TssE [Pseudomonadota bacterium]